MQIQEYHNLLINTIVLHDGESQDWGDTKAYEGDRISPAIQFWGYHLQGVRMDLYSSLPPAVAQPMMGKIFGDSLGILTVRYCQIHPTARRLAQYRADITAILLISHDLLLSVVSSLNHLFHPSPKVASGISRTVHTKCTILASALTLIGCPIKILGRTLEGGAGGPAGMAQMGLLPPIDEQPGSGRLQPMEKVREGIQNYILRRKKLRL